MLTNKIASIPQVLLPHSLQDAIVLVNVQIYAMPFPINMSNMLTQMPQVQAFVRLLLIVIAAVTVHKCAKLIRLVDKIKRSILALHHLVAVAKHKFTGFIMFFFPCN